MIKRHPRVIDYLLVLLHQQLSFDQDEGLPEALAVAGGIGDERVRTEALTELAPYFVGWVSQERPATYVAWRETLHAIAACARRHPFSDLRALTPSPTSLAANKPWQKPSTPFRKSAAGGREVGIVEAVERH